MFVGKQMIFKKKKNNNKNKQIRIYNQIFQEKELVAVPFAFKNQNKQIYIYWIDVRDPFALL